MRLTALVKSPEHVCCRYRVSAYRPAFLQAGVELQLQAWSGSWLSGFLLHRQLREADTVLLQRTLPANWQLNTLRQAAPRLLFDFDDAVFLRDSYATRGPISDRRLQRFARVVQAADVVVAGNDYLAEQAALWTEPAKIHVIPTCVDVDRYPLARHRHDRHVHLTWIGSSSTLRGLQRVRPLLEQLGEALPGLRLKIICDRSLTLRNLPVDFCPWSSATETTDLAEADIGLSWLPDDGWSRGKCGLKVLQYMAAGLPVVANPVGLQEQLVDPGVTGFLAETPAEWLEAVECLACDPELRRRMGLAGRRKVEEAYSVQHGASLWRQLLTGTSEPTRRTVTP